MGLPFSLKTLFGVVFVALVLGLFLGLSALPSLWTYLPPALLQQAAVGTLPFASAAQAGEDGAAQAATALAQAGLPSREGDGAVLASRAENGAQPRGGLLVLAEAEPETAQTAETVYDFGEQPLACIYCTHTTENYAGQQRGHQAGGILDAARALADSLEAMGMKTVLCETVHDSPDWSAAYGNSLASIQALKEKYPSLQLFVDVHRDSSIAGVNTQLSYGDETWAKMMLVVGSNQRLTHDNWKQNQQFSQSVADLLDEKAPGIVRGVRVSASRYNQHLSTKAILVEIGSTDNTVEEACRSATLLGQVLAELMAAAKQG